MVFLWHSQKKEDHHPEGRMAPTGEEATTESRRSKAATAARIKARNALKALKF